MFLRNDGQHRHTETVFHSNLPETKIPEKTFLRMSLIAANFFFGHVHPTHPPQDGIRKKRKRDTHMSAKVLRRQLRYLNKASRRVGKASARLDAGFTTDMLPTNQMLESAMAHTLAHNKDGRTMLDFTRHFLHSNLLSLASPVGQWDPYDVKPQVFALDTFIALPVFTSVGYLQHFCSAFSFTVRDPSGNLWACPSVPKIEWPASRNESKSESTATEEPTTNSNSSASTAASSSTVQHEGDAAANLYSFLNDEEVVSGNPAENEKSDRRKRDEKKKKPIKGGTKKRKATTSTDDDKKRADKQADRNSDAEHFWGKVSRVPTFGIKKATPLPCFGPFIRPYFVGYFADVETLLSSTSIVPEKVDVVLNPQSPLELVLARDMTDKVLHRRTLIKLCYEQVEKEVRGEFHRYFAANCPEVKCAYSVCMPEQVSDLMPKNEIPYRILLAVESLDFQLTWQKIRAAKHSGQLLGHSSLTIIPYGEATDVGKGMLTVFYAKRAAGRRADRSDGDRFGVFGAAGPVATVDMHHDASSFYHDPSNTYTEAHSVFTDMLKYSPPDLSRE